MAQVTITGVAGFLGSHLADAFIARGWDVKGVDNLIGGYHHNIPEAVDFYQLDLAKDLDALDAAFYGSELVIHAACTAYEGLSVFSPSLVIQNTVQASTNALVASQRGGAKKFVYLSSMARYGDHDGVHFTEDMETKSQDPYGIAKVASEQLVKNICETHGMDWVILVPHNIIGPRQKFNDPFRNVASIMTNRMLQGKQPIIYGDGTQQRCFSFVEDVVNPLMVASLTDKASKQVINIGPDESPITINELARQLSDILGFELDPIYMPGRPQEVPIALCSSDKARQLLNYETSMSLTDGLTSLVNWIKEQPKLQRKFDYHLPLEIVTDKVPRTWSERLM